MPLYYLDPLLILYRTRYSTVVISLSGKDITIGNYTINVINWFSSLAEDSGKLDKLFIDIYNINIKIGMLSAINLFLNLYNKL